MPCISTNIELAWKLSRWLTNITNKKKIQTWNHYYVTFLKPISPTWAPRTYSLYNSYYPFPNQEKPMRGCWSALKYYTILYQVWKWAKYMILSVSMFSIWDSILKIKHTVLKLFTKDFKWVFHMRWLPECKPKNYIVSVSTRILQCMLNLTDSRRL
jgi:hypothetical protein